MSTVWAAPQASRFRNFLEAIFGLSTDQDDWHVARPEPDRQAPITPGLALHPALASTSHMAATHRVEHFGRWSQTTLDDGPAGIMIVPGDALAADFVDHVTDLGFQTLGLPTLGAASRRLQGEAERWTTLVLDIDARPLTRDDGLRLDALCRDWPSLTVILVSSGAEARGGIENGRRPLSRPFSLQQLEVALECQ